MSLPPGRDNISRTHTQNYKQILEDLQTSHNTSSNLVFPSLSLEICQVGLCRTGSLLHFLPGGRCLVSKLHRNFLSKQVVTHIQGLIPFSMSEIRYGLQVQVSFFSSLSVVTFARASNVAANRGRLCFVFSFQASPVDGSVKISFRVGSNL